MTGIAASATGVFVGVGARGATVVAAGVNAVGAEEGRFRVTGGRLPPAVDAAAGRDQGGCNGPRSRPDW